MMSDQLANANDGLEESLIALEQIAAALHDDLQTAIDKAHDKGFSLPQGLHDSVDKLERSVLMAQNHATRTLRSLSHLNALVRISALLTGSLDLDVVVNEVLDTITDLAGAERTYLMLYDDNDVLFTYAARNWDHETLDDEEVEFSQSVIRAAIEDGQPILTTNAQSDDRFGGMKSVVLHDLRSILCLPLVLRGEMVGVLYTDNRFRKGVFLDDMIPILGAFGTQAAIAIKNARIFGEVQQDLEAAKSVFAQLHIAVDEGNVSDEVTSITDSEYFKSLANFAVDLRKKLDAGRGTV